jgi:hypothetical protein
LEPALSRLNDGRTRGRALIVGSKVYIGREDRRAVYESAFGVDLFEGEGVDLVHDLEKPLPKNAGTFAHVECCSVLEHVRRPWLLTANVEAVMDEGATILICVPFAWRLHEYPGDYWRVTPQGLEVLFPSVEWSTRAWLVDGALLKKLPTWNDLNGRRWIERTELAAFGRKCSKS